MANIEVRSAQDTQAAWDAFSPQRTPDAFHARLTEGLPAETAVSVNLSRFGTIIKIEGDGFFFSRIINKHGVRHDHADVQQGKGQGIAKIVNRNMMRLYDELGIEDIGMTASDMGVYAWARTGFTPEPKAWERVREQVSARLRFIEENPPPEGPLPAAVADGLRAALASADPKSYWQVVDAKTQAYGKDLGKLLTMAWTQEDAARGLPLDRADPSLHKLDAVKMSLNTKDAVAMQRFRDYVTPAAGAKPSVARPVSP